MKTPIRKLTKLAFSSSILVGVISGLGSLFFGIFFSGQKLLIGLTLDDAVFGLSLILSILIISFLSAGIVGACRGHRCPLGCFVAVLIVASIYSLCLLIYFVMLYAYTESQITQHCDGDLTSPFLGDLSPVRTYDNLIRNLGLTGFFCGIPCECNISSNPYLWTAYTATSDLSSTNSFVITDSSSGITRIQSCSLLWDDYTESTKQFIQMMGEIETSENCAGVCVASNISVASSTQNQATSVNYLAGEGSCFSKYVEKAQSKWLICIIFYVFIFSFNLFGAISNLILCKRLRKRKIAQFV